MKTKRQQNDQFSLENNHFYLKIFAFLLSGAIMIGHGLRMIYQGVFAPNSYYHPNTFDLFFDWGSLLVLGFFVLWFSLTQFKKYYTARYNSENKEEDFLPVVT